jgi:hypothetical protein
MGDISELPEEHTICIVCELDNVNDHIKRVWTNFQENLAFCGEIYGIAWADECKKLGVHVVKTNCIEGGVCTADVSREIRFSGTTKGVSPLKVYPLGNPFVRAYVSRGVWSFGDIMKVSKALRNLLVGLINGSEDNVKFYVEIHVFIGDSPCRFWNGA